jgi:hypothetical protein
VTLSAVMPAVAPLPSPVILAFTTVAMRFSVAAAAPLRPTPKPTPPATATEPAKTRALTVWSASAVMLRSPSALMDEPTV